MSQRTRRGDWMQTYSGISFWPLDPRIEDINIIDIGHSLSQQCRYAGHTEEFYSVAQHSVILSRVVPPEFALTALLHDASEAYLVDLPRPIKNYSKLGSVYKKMENKIQALISEKFGLIYPLPEIVIQYDTRILLNEKRSLMQLGPDWRFDGITALETIGDITSWPSKDAEHEFIYTYNILTNMNAPEAP